MKVTIWYKDGTFRDIYDLQYIAFKDRLDDDIRVDVSEIDNFVFPKCTPITFQGKSQKACIPSWNDIKDIFINE